MQTVPSPALSKNRLKKLFLHPLQALVLAFAYAALSTPAAYLANPNTLAAIVWPAPALAVALLWTLPYRKWWPYLLAVFVAMMAVGDFDKLPLGTDAAYALLNVFEIALCAGLGRRYVCKHGQLDTTRKLARYLLLLPLLTTCLVAVLGASIGTLSRQTSWIAEWRVLLVGNGLAILVLLPALLTWCTPQLLHGKPAEQSAVIPGAAALASLLFLVSSLVHHLSSDVLRALLSLVLVWAAISSGTRAVSLSILSAAATGIGLTLAGQGAYREGTEMNGIWELQVDLAGLAMLSFFVAVASQERRQLDIRLERAKRFEAMGFLAGGIAHDFNNVLGAVGGYAEMATLQAGPAAQGSLREVTLAIGRGKDLTEQILLAGRRGERSQQVIDLRHVIIKSAALARAQLPAGLAMTVSVPSRPVFITGHEGQLVRAMLNLMRNAAQAGKSQVAIALKIALPDSDLPNATQAPQHLVGEWLEKTCAWVDVTDDGGGIPKAHIPQLFDPFFSSRMSDGSPRSGRGTGLGLAIVAGVAADHGGGIALWSGHGAATLFRFMLPLHAGHEDLPSHQGVETTGNGEPVLLLEPDRDLLAQREEWLAELGFEPHGFVCGTDMLTALKVAPDRYALLITRLALVQSQHRELLSSLRELAPQLPIIFGVADADAPIAAQSASLIGLPASADLAALQTAVAMALGSRTQAESS